jgi:subtilisin family serine protease
LIKIYENEGQEAAAQFAARRNIPFKNGQLRVVLNAKPFFAPIANPQLKESRKTRERQAAINQAVSLVKTGIERLGGRVEKNYRYLVQCSIGIDAIKELTGIPLVRSVRRPLKLHLHATSEGVQKTGANEYHDLAAFKSSGVKVCVLDVGFQDYQDLLGTELPESVTTRSFTDDEDIEADEVHGTACAEIVHDMAPDAELYLANIYWDIDLIDAVTWIVEQEIDIISYSLGSYFGAGDGTGLENLLAEWAYQYGVTWVTSAGNAADDHWSGTWNDPDNDGWHNFSGEDEILSFIVPADLGIEYGIDAYLKWNDWGTWDDYYGYSGSDQDFDLYLYRKIGGQWQLIDTSENRQPQFQWPWESIEGWYSDFDAEWGVAIRKNQASKSVFFDLYIPVHTTGTLEYIVPGGSLSAPADSPYIIAVGAVDAVGDFYHYYSSQGPTTDGRIKPDISAPSWVSTSDTTYGSRDDGDGFSGTSAACPHVAGDIALLKGKTPFTVDEILDILYSRAIDMGDPGKDNKFGWGRLNLRR